MAEIRTVLIDIAVLLAGLYSLYVLIADVHYDRRVHICKKLIDTGYGALCKF
jgi:hypothetical protein